MPNRAGAHPYLEIFAASLIPRMNQGAGHEKDPPAPNVLPLPSTSEEARQLLDLLLGADRDIRDDHARAAGINLALAESKLRLAMSHGGPRPPLEAALSGIALAKEAMAKNEMHRALSALAGAARSLCNVQRPPVAATGPATGA